MRAVSDLVDANHILRNEGAIDAEGHVSLRDADDPARFLLSCAEEPARAAATDVLRFGLDGEPLASAGRMLPVERFIHAAVYAARPEVVAVVHSHHEDLLPYTVSATPLRPSMNTARALMGSLPVWDIRAAFGETVLLVTNLAEARDLLRRMGAMPVVLMRGHGYTIASGSLYDAVALAINLPKIARVHRKALALGDVHLISEGEIRVHTKAEALYPGQTPRAWEYWKARATPGTVE